MTTLFTHIGCIFHFAASLLSNLYKIEARKRKNFVNRLFLKLVNGKPVKDSMLDAGRKITDSEFHFARNKYV